MMNRVVRAPESCAWLLTLLFAMGVSVAVYRIPIQVSDSLEVLEGVDRSASIRTAFVDALTSSRTMLRPLRQAQTKLLLTLSPPTGAGYTRSFRGFHALGAGLLFFLFTATLRPRSWGDVAALAFSLTVLIGLHTTFGMLREAYPINHFLLIAIYCTAVLALARSGGGPLQDVVAVACFALAALTLESGLLVFPLAFVGYLRGLRGISRRALAAMLVLVAGYVALRVGYLHMVGNGVGERATGYGLSGLDGETIRARFSEHPLPLYAYTIAGSILTVLFSQPVNGTWTMVRDWLNGTIAPAEGIAFCSSVATTGLIAWYLSGRDEMGRRRMQSPLSLMGLTILIGSAGISYAYAKSEIMSAAGVFYALLAYEVARRVPSHVAGRGAPARVCIAVAAVLLSSLWAVRAMGLQYHLERAAFATRNDWVHDRSYELGAHTSTALASSLKQQALRRARTNPTLLPPGLEQLWGDE